jgi:CBS domain-containing protein
MTMQTMGTAMEVLIYIGESDRWGRKPLHMAILEMLRKEDCAGATVIRGLAGFGAASRIHTASIVALSEDLPLVIHWVDLPERVERVMPRLVEMVAEGLITAHEVQVVTYSHRRLRELRQGAPVQDIMHREVRTIQPATPLAEAAETLLTSTYHTLPVIDEQRRVVGMLTDGDLLNRAGLLATSVRRELTTGELTRQLAALRETGRTVAEVMTPDPVTVNATMTITEAVHLMAERHIKRLPVVDASGRLIGIVSRLDVLRALSQPIARATPQPVPQPGRHVRVGDIMLTSVPAVTAEAPLNEVVDLITGTAQRRVVVIDEGHHVVGIITDADILNRALESERPALLKALTDRTPVEGGQALHLGRRTAADVMTRKPITVQPDTPLLEALQLLLTHKIKRLPVVDGEGRLVGLVGRGGILEALSKEL